MANRPLANLPYLSQRLGNSTSASNGGMPDETSNLAADRATVLLIDDDEASPSRPGARANLLISCRVIKI